MYASIPHPAGVAIKHGIFPDNDFLKINLMLMRSLTLRDYAWI
jgi:hypothetical protein